MVLAAERTKHDSNTCDEIALSSRVYLARGSSTDGATLVLLLRKGDGLSCTFEGEYSAVDAVDDVRRFLPCGLAGAKFISWICRSCDAE